MPALPDAALVFAPHADKQEQIRRQNERAISALQERAQSAPAISPVHSVRLHDLSLPRVRFYDVRLCYSLLPVQSCEHD